MRDQTEQHAVVRRVVWLGAICVLGGGLTALLVVSRGDRGVTVKRTIQCEAPATPPSADDPDPFDDLANDECTQKLIATVTEACDLSRVSAVELTTGTNQPGLSFQATSTYPCSLDLEALTQRIAAS